MLVRNMCGPRHIFTILSWSTLTPEEREGCPEGVAVGKPVGAADVVGAVEIVGLAEGLAVAVGLDEIVGAKDN